MLQQHKDNNGCQIFIKGFTFIEIILSIALLGILAAVAIPVGYEIQSRNEIDVARLLIAENFRNAETNARAVSGDSSWGVYIDTGMISLYRGSSYAARVYEEVTEISSAISISGMQEVVFNKFTGEPVSTGTTTISSSRGGVRSIGVNEKGTINY